MDFQPEAREVWLWQVIWRPEFTPVVYHYRSIPRSLNRSTNAWPIRGGTQYAAECGGEESTTANANGL
jgi:hypothetical protein